MWQVLLILKKKCAHRSGIDHSIHVLSPNNARCKSELALSHICSLNLYQGSVIITVSSEIWTHGTCDELMILVISITSYFQIWGSDIIIKFSEIWS